MNFTAKIISYIFHPLLMPLIGLLIIFNTDSYINYTVPKELKRAIIILIAVSTVIIPLLISLLLLNKKLISSLEMETRKERVLPYAFTIIFYVFTLYMLKQAPIIPHIIFNFIIGGTLSIIIAFIINIKWKISAHMIGIGGLIGALICLSFILEVYITPYIVVGILVAGLLGSSRLILKAHSPLQVYIGFFIGILCQVITLYY